MKIFLMQNELPNEANFGRFGDSRMEGRMVTKIQPET